MILSPSRCSAPHPRGDREFDQWFQREAESLAKLQNTSCNIVRFYSFEREGRLAFIVMDYVEGITLRAHIFDAHGLASARSARHHKADRFRAALCT